MSWKSVRPLSICAWTDICGENNTILFYKVPLQIAGIWKGHYLTNIPQTPLKNFEYFLWLCVADFGRSLRWHFSVFFLEKGI